MFLTFITTCIFQFRFAMALVRAQEEALVFKRLQLRWQGLMLLTFFTTHVFQFRFAELSIIGTPNHPSFVMSCSARHSVLWELGTSFFLRSRIRCWLSLNRSQRHLEYTCQWINIVPVTVLLSSIIVPSNFEDVPVNMPGRTPWTRLAQKALRGMKVAATSLNWIPLSSTFIHSVSALASSRLPCFGLRYKQFAELGVSWRRLATSSRT